MLFNFTPIILTFTRTPILVKVRVWLLFLLKHLYGTNWKLPL